MSGKYALFEPETQDQRKEFIEATVQMDTMIKNFVEQTEKWHANHRRLGSADTACLEAVAVEVGRAFSLKV